MTDSLSSSIISSNPPISAWGVSVNRANAFQMAFYTFERDGYLFGRDDFHGNGLLVGREHQLIAVQPLPDAVLLLILFVFLPGEYTLQLAVGGDGFLAGFFLGGGVGIELGEEVADNEVHQHWLHASVSRSSSTAA